MKSYQIKKIAVVLLGFFFALTSQAADLFVSSSSSDQVLRYDSSGNYLGVFASGGGLDGPAKFVFGPDSTGDGWAELYVASHFSDQVLRYNGVSGAFIDVFVSAGSGGLDGPEGLAFGSDGKLYVASHISDTVLRYNGTTGAFIDTFVSAGSGGIDNPRDLVFGPDWNLYVGNEGNKSVLRYNGSTGAAMPSPGNSGATYATDGTSLHRGLLFGPDGNGDGFNDLYVGTDNDGGVLRYQGPQGASPGALVDIFVSPTNGWAVGLGYGPDNNLYVVAALSNKVVRYNGTTGALIGDFVTTGSGGLNSPTYLDFQTIPEPSACHLLVFAGSIAALSGFRSRRRQ